MMNDYTTRINAVKAVLDTLNITIKRVVRTKGDVTEPEIILTDGRVICVGLRTIVLHDVPTRRGLIGPVLVMANDPHLDVLAAHL